MRVESFLRDLRKLTPVGSDVVLLDSEGEDFALEAGIFIFEHAEHFHVPDSIKHAVALIIPAVDVQVHKAPLGVDPDPEVCVSDSGDALGGGAASFLKAWVPCYSPSHVVCFRAIHLLVVAALDVTKDTLFPGLHVVEHLDA